MFHCLPDSAWADGNLAEVVRQLGKKVEHRNQIQPNPGLRAHGTPCTRTKLLRNILLASVNTQQKKRQLSCNMTRSITKNNFKQELHEDLALLKATAEPQSK